jgi:hypothetical protein
MSNPSGELARLNASFHFKLENPTIAQISQRHRTAGICALGDHILASKFVFKG